MILVTLAFRGLRWGLTGVLLSILLTAPLRVVWENMACSPLVVVMAEGDG